MKASRIFEIMDLAETARSIGEVFNPMFRGEAGVGKSEVVQQWVARKKEGNPNFGFIDLRMAYLEAPDVIGLPKEVEYSGRWRTIHALPGFWPVDPNSEGVLLLEEVNRAPTSVTNALMQLLTDRKILSDDPSNPDYTLPEKWIIASAVNPDTAKYDVQPMDQALIDRFVQFDIDYDHNCFVDFAERRKWHANVLLFLKSAIWVYKKADAISKDGKYISPRTWARMNAAEKSGLARDKALHRIVAQSILGKHVGNEYWKATHDDRPIMASDILADYHGSITKLGDQSKNGQYAGDKIAMTVESIIENYGGWFDGSDKTNDPTKIDEKTMAAIGQVIPADQAAVLIQGCILKTATGSILDALKAFAKRHPACIKLLHSNIKISQSVEPNK